jgi:hypothetical protein
MLYPPNLFRDFIIAVFATELEPGNYYFRPSLSGPYIPYIQVSSVSVLPVKRNSADTWDHITAVRVGLLN